MIAPRAPARAHRGLLRLLSEPMANTLQGRPPSLGEGNPTRVRIVAANARLKLLLVIENLGGPNVAHLATQLGLSAKVRYAVLDDAEVPGKSTYFGTTRMNSYRANERRAKKYLHDNAHGSARSSPNSLSRSSLALLSDSSAISANRSTLNPRRSGIAGRGLEPKHFDDYIMQDRAAREARLSNITQKGAKRR